MNTIYALMVLHVAMLFIAITNSVWSYYIVVHLTDPTYMPLEHV